MCVCVGVSIQIEEKVICYKKALKNIRKNCSISGDYVRVAPAIIKESRFVIW